MELSAACGTSCVNIRTVKFEKLPKASCSYRIQSEANCQPRLNGSRNSGFCLWQLSGDHTGPQALRPKHIKIRPVRRPPQQRPAGFAEHIAQRNSTVGVENVSRRTGWHPVQCLHRTLFYRSIGMPEAEGLGRVIVPRTRTRDADEKRRAESNPNV
jgi:hypothetical protein